MDGARQINPYGRRRICEPVALRCDLHSNNLLFELHKFCLAPIARLFIDDNQKISMDCCPSAIIMHTKETAVARMRCRTAMSLALVWCDFIIKIDDWNEQNMRRQNLTRRQPHLFDPKYSLFSAGCMRTQYAPSWRRLRSSDSPSTCLSEFGEQFLPKI